MDTKRKGITTAAIVGSAILILILVLGTVWMGRSAKSDTEKAVRSVSLFYLNELAGRREQVVEANIEKRKQDMNTAIDLLSAEDLSDQAHLQDYQLRIKIRIIS